MSMCMSMPIDWYRNGAGGSWCYTYERVLVWQSEREWRKRFATL